MSKSDNHGFTLIELAVSIALLALLGFGAVSLFPRGLTVVERARTITVSADLAQAQMETIISEPYQTVTTGTYEARHTITEVFDRQTTVSYIDPITLAQSGSDLGLKKIVVTVFYPTQNGERTFMLSTLIARK